MGRITVVLTDFERTLVRLFEDGGVEQEFHHEVRRLCADRGVQRRVISAAGDSPYSVWTRAYRWMIRHEDPLSAEMLYHAVSKIATRYEMDATSSVRLFDDVRPTLERLKFAHITVAIVSNNASAAVQRALRNNNVECLVDHVIGREYRHKMVGNLKPRPLLLQEALQLSGHAPDTALLVGDSVDDMRAGRAAGIRFRVGVLQHSTASEWQLRKAGARVVLHRFGDLQDHPVLRRLLFGTDGSGVR